MESKKEVHCREAVVSDVLIFFLINYIVHAVTALKSPGSSIAATADAALVALLVPYKGIFFAVRVISLQAFFCRDPLQRAHRARALCCVVRTTVLEGKPAHTFDGGTEKIFLIWRVKTNVSCAEWQPGPIQSLKDVHAKIHGLINLPQGYDLAIVPKFVRVEPLDDTEHKPGTYTSNIICCNYNIVKVFASIVQTVAGCISLYHARDHQLLRLGYTAYSLTVIPYMLMSLTNLVASLSCPEYPTLYIVDSELLQAATYEGATVHGTVGRVNSFVRRPRTLFERFFKRFLYLISAGLVVFPFLAIGLLTKFQPGPDTTVEEKAWILSWLITSILFGVPLGYTMKDTYTHSLSTLWRQFKSFRQIKAHAVDGWIGKIVYASILGFFIAIFIFLRLVTWFIIFLTPIGMFVTVARQVLKYGVCKWV